MIASSNTNQKSLQLTQVLIKKSWRNKNLKENFQKSDNIAKEIIIEIKNKSKLRSSSKHYNHRQSGKQINGITKLL